MATSLEGALFQVMLANSMAEWISMQAEDDTEEDLRRVKGSLYSAAAVLEQLIGVSRQRLFGERYMRAGLDPHLTGEFRDA